MAKTIIITESQYDRLLCLLEDNIPDYDDGDIKEYLGSEVSTTTTVHDNDGNPKYGKMPTTDKVSNELTPQQWMASHRAGRGPRF